MWTNTFILSLLFTLIFSSLYSQDNDPVVQRFYNLETYIYTDSLTQMDQITRQINERPESFSKEFIGAYLLASAVLQIRNNALIEGEGLLDSAEQYISDRDNRRLSVYHIQKAKIHRIRLDANGAFLHYDSAHQYIKGLSDPQIIEIILLTEIGYTHYQFHDYLKAINYFEKVLAINDEHSGALIGLALVQMDRRHFEDAREAYTRFERSPRGRQGRKTEVLNYLKASYYRAKNQMDSVAFYTKENSNYDNMGWILFDENQFDSAEYYFLKSFHLFESQQNALGMLRALIAIAYAKLFSHNLYAVDSLLTRMEDDYADYLQDNDPYVLLTAHVERTRENYEGAFQIYLDHFDNEDYIEPQTAISILDNLTSIYPELENYERAQAFHNTLAKRISKSISSSYDRQQIIEVDDLNRLNAKFLESGIKLNDTRLKLQEEERRAQISLIFLVFSLLLVAILLFFAYYVYRSRQKIAQMNETLQDKARVLDEANFEKEMLLVTISHQIKTPFTNILYFFDMSKNLIAERNVAELSRFLDLLNSTAEKSYHRVMGVLGWLKIGKSEQIENAQVHLEVLLREIWDFHEVDIADKNLRLKFEDSVAHVFWETSKEGLRIIFQNIIENAVKYSRQDSDVMVSAEAENSLTITNMNEEPEGVGAKDNQTGMGLVIIKDLCNRLDIKFQLNRTDCTTTAVLDARGLKVEKIVNEITTHQG